jgi:Flp pilus assembly protein TadB
LQFTRDLGKYCMNIEHLFTPLLPTFDIKRSLLANSSQLAENTFMARVITSHLQTHGSTVVTGSNEYSVNMVEYHSLATHHKRSHLLVFIIVVIVLIIIVVIVLIIIVVVIITIVVIIVVVLIIIVVGVIMHRRRILPSSS